MTSDVATEPELLRQRLAQALPGLGLVLTVQQVDALLAYLTLIQKWNKVYNLTAVRDPAEMLTHHLLDSLAVVGPLRNRLAALKLAMQAAEPEPPVATTPTPTSVRLLDVGSGAGLPGIVIAICFPDIQVDCVDTVARKRPSSSRWRSHSSCQTCAVFMPGWRVWPGLMTWSAQGPSRRWLTSQAGRRALWQGRASGWR